MPRHVLLVVAFVFLSVPTAQAADGTDWPSYNRSLTSERFVPVGTITPKNVAALQVACSYDIGAQTSFQSGLIQVKGALFGTTTHDTFSIDPDTCKQNWRVHEDFTSSGSDTNRGLAWLDGRVYRGTADGRVLAYDARDGRRLWQTTIADPAKGESVTAAPIAWNGLVFVGNSGKDGRGVKGRMVALDANDGHIVWEFYLAAMQETDFARGPHAPLMGGSALAWQASSGAATSGGVTWASYSLNAANGLLYVPGGAPAPYAKRAPGSEPSVPNSSIVVLDAKSGAFLRHFPLVKRDFHNWGVSNAPVLLTSKASRTLLAAAPKDGRLHVLDLANGAVLYNKPMTRAFNTDTPVTAQGTRFCPGSQGGAEWNGAAFDPTENLIFTGEVDWCTTLRDAPADPGGSSAPAMTWSGSPAGFGKQDEVGKWAGWMTASDVDSGKRHWQVKTAFPLLGGITPTSGGVVFFGDIGGTLYAYASATGKKLWSQDLAGAIGGGVISYDTGAGQKVAVATGMTSPLWPTRKVNAKIVVLGLPATVAPDADSKAR